MDISEQTEHVENIEANRMREKGIFWNPRTQEKREQYARWLLKQHNQQRKTLMQDGVTHSRARKDQLRRLAGAYKEEYKRMKDLLEDGR